MQPCYDTEDVTKQMAHTASVTHLHTVSNPVSCTADEWKYMLQFALHHPLRPCRQMFNAKKATSAMPATGALGPGQSDCDPVVSMHRLM